MTRSDRKIRNLGSPRLSYEVRKQVLLIRQRKRRNTGRVADETVVLTIAMQHNIAVGKGLC
jgi:hypothetical protein